MDFSVLKDKNASRVFEVTIGATPLDGGTRSNTVKIGGESALPFLHFEGEFPNKPVIAMEVQDILPDWDETLKKELDDVWGDPVQWAQKCVEEYNAELIYLKLDGSHPDKANHSPDKCVKLVEKVLKNTGVPLIISGCEVTEKDNIVLPLIAEATKGENLLFGSAEQDNYKALATACMANNHSLIARSPLDINICKQLNILIAEMNMPIEKIFIDPGIGGLGYGIEYSFSILERIRLGALKGDKMLSMPIIATVGYEAWKTKEAMATIQKYPEWGKKEERGILWETVTAAALLQSGCNIILLRHPKSLKLIEKNIEELMQPSII